MLPQSKLSPNSQSQVTLRSEFFPRRTHDGGLAATGSYELRDLVLPGKTALEPAPQQVAQRVRDAFEHILRTLHLTDEERSVLRQNFPEVVTSEIETSYFRHPQPFIQPAVIAIHPSHFDEPKAFYEECGHYIRESLMPQERDLLHDKELVRLLNRCERATKVLGPLAWMFRRAFNKKMAEALYINQQVHEFFGALMVGLIDQEQHEKAWDDFIGSGGTVGESELRGELERHTEVIYHNAETLEVMQNQIERIRLEEKRTPSLAFDRIFRNCLQLAVAVSGGFEGADLADVRQAVQKQALRHRKQLDSVGPYPAWSRNYLRNLAALRDLMASGYPEREIVPVCVSLIRDMVGAVQIESSRRQKLSAVGRLAQQNANHEYGYAAANDRGRMRLSATGLEECTNLIRLPSSRVFATWGHAMFTFHHLHMEFSKLMGVTSSFHY